MTIHAIGPRGPGKGRLRFKGPRQGAMALGSTAPTHWADLAALVQISRTDEEAIARETQKRVYKEGTRLPKAKEWAGTKQHPDG